MYYNGQRSRNVGFVPHIQSIRQMLDNERLAISPQLNFKLETKESVMKKQERAVETEVDQTKRKAILHHKIGACPQCGIGDLWAVCTVKNFDTGDYSPECDYCGYVESK